MNPEHKQPSFEDKVQSMKDRWTETQRPSEREANEKQAQELSKSLHELLDDRDIGVLVGTLINMYRQPKLRDAVNNLRVAMSEFESYNR